VEKIECKLASWKMMYLSKGGRVTLIKSTLSNLLNIFLVFIEKKYIKKLQRDFLWGGIDDEFRYHLVSWSKVCLV
jgi:hypothetical protein